MFLIFLLCILKAKIKHLSNLFFLLRIREAKHVCMIAIYVFCFFIFFSKVRKRWKERKVIEKHLDREIFARVYREIFAWFKKGEEIYI